MATHIFRDGALYIAEYDFSGRAKSFGFDIAADAVDMTTLGNATRIHAGGLRSVMWAAELLYDATSYESRYVTNITASGGSEATVISFFPSGAAAEDEIAYFLRGRPKDLKLPWSIGDAAGMTIGGESADLGSGAGAQSLVSGRLSALGAAVAATANGTGRQLGALADARSFMLMAGHVTSITGTATVQFILQSDDNSGFTSPTTRATATTISAAGQLWVAPVPGPVTDDYWRVRYVIGGTGTATFKASMGRIVT